MSGTCEWVSALPLACTLLVLPGCEPSEPLGPDGLPVLPRSVGAWLTTNAAPLLHLEPGGAAADLAPLREAFAAARIVALGEATHGTREFALVKHRLVRYLVRELGFDAIAMEAPWAEANRLNDHVLTGAGDPQQLLSGLYLWPWNTREVLDMVAWLGAHNRGAADPVQFLGLDMQFPGMPIHNVKAFVSRVDPGNLPWIDAALACLERFANDPTGRFPDPEYADQPRQAYREPCRRSLDEVYAFLASREAEYTRASSAEAFATALRSARIAVQFEDHASSLTLHMRDLYMAENAAWLLDRLGPDGKLILWAHNFHVSNMPVFMGQALRQRFGDDVVLVGFSFHRGSFNAGPPGLPTLLGRPEPHSVGVPVPYSYEHHFAAAGMPWFALPLRHRADPVPRWLTGPRPLRGIGSDFDPADPDGYFYSSRLTREFDVVVYVHDSTPSTLLPFRYPGAF